MLVYELFTTAAPYADLSRDEHVIGPTLKLALEPDGKDVAFRVGTFFGLTDAAPTLAVSANVDFGF